MKVIFFSGRPFLPFSFYSGASRTAATLLERLAPLGCRCRVVSLIPKKPEGKFLWRQIYSPDRIPREASLFHYDFCGTEVAVARDARAYLSFARHLLEDASSRPDVIWTELEYSAEILTMACAAGVPSLYWVKDLFEGTLNHVFPGCRWASVIMASTLHVGRELEARWGREVSIVPEALDFEAYRVKGLRDPRYVTMVNPVGVKGGEIFFQVARRMRDRRFLAVLGWPRIRCRDHLRRTLEKGMPNVVLWPPQEDMRKVYARTSVLMVPSLCREAFGRVITEALLNGIPVVASKRGGIPEVLGPAGILIDKPENVGAWVRALERIFSEKGLYRSLSREGVRQAGRFGLDSVTKRFFRVLTMAARGHSHEN